ncbi:hypothetical protein IC006_0694 [Sulfuracidifex tepidarius]|uniref:Uncharacterized protein n=1 Tax=Sulfuracidifex tepidarius TaxID=1294262 RepID=A0A510DTK3_9CREN|nr:hypothetical protein IC006_0694 [Sulfuracidifex tepidarius]
MPVRIKRNYITRTTKSVKWSRYVLSSSLFRVGKERITYLNSSPVSP